MTSKPYIRAGVFSAILALSSAWGPIDWVQEASAQSAATPNASAQVSGAQNSRTQNGARVSLPDLTPEQIVEDIKITSDNRSGTQEYAAPTFDPFENRAEIAGSASLRTVTRAVSIDGQNLQDGAILDLAFFYNQTGGNPDVDRGFEKIAFLSGSQAPTVLRDSRALECAADVQRTTFDQGFHVRSGFVHPYGHYSGHRGFGHSSFGRSGFGNRGFGHSGFGHSGFGGGFRHNSFGGRGFGSRSFGHRSFGRRGFGNRGFGRRGFGHRGFNRGFRGGHRGHGRRFNDAGNFGDIQNFDTTIAITRSSEITQDQAQRANGQAIIPSRTLAKSNGIAQLNTLNFFPDDIGHNSGRSGRRVITSSRTNCTREELLSVHIPADRLDAARFDGLMVVAIDRKGQELPIFIPANYIEGLRLATTGQYDSRLMRLDGRPPLSMPQGQSQQGIANQSVPSRATPNGLIASCPVGTVFQANDGTCLLDPKAQSGAYPQP